jgi:hypothetical protein
MVVVEEQEQRIYDQVENENASLADHLPVALPKLTWKLLLNKAILSHEPKGEKSKTEEVFYWDKHVSTINFGMPNDGRLSSCAGML